MGTTAVTTLLVLAVCLWQKSTATVWIKLQSKEVLHFQMDIALAFNYQQRKQTVHNMT